MRADLDAHRDLWDSVALIPEDPGLFIRDLPDGSYHCDSLYILTTKPRWKALKKVVVQWQADHITKIGPKGSKVADRWESKDCESYEFRKCKHHEQKIGFFLGSWSLENDQKIALRLWWD